MPSILQTIVDKKHYHFAESMPSWQDAVRVSAESLVADGSVDETYYQQIVDCISKYGPYVVFDHGVAMPHSQENATGVHKTGIGFMHLNQPVSFGQDEDGEEKTASLFFTLASCDPNEHLDNIKQIMDICCNEPLLDALLAAQTPEDLLAAEIAHPCTDD